MASPVFFYHANSIIVASYPNLFSAAEPSGNTSEEIEASIKSIRKGEKIWEIYGWFNLLVNAISGGWFNGQERTPEHSVMNTSLYRVLAYLDRQCLINNLS